MAEAALADPVAAFLAASPAAGWASEALPGDASARRYRRLRGPECATAILMDARAEPGPVAPFLRIAAHLRALGLAAPRVLAQAPGLLLLEDLGEEHAAAWLARHPGDEGAVYEAAVDALLALQAAAPPPDLVALTPTRAAGMIAPLFEHHAPAADPRAAALLTGRLREALALHAPEAAVLSLRDFHAENLVWRPGRAGLDRLGLLDFQDAVLAPPAYDLASLLRDARRDVGEAAREAALARFAHGTGTPRAALEAATAVLAVQRNLRILGVLSRLGSARPHYLALLPRVRAHLDADLAHPALRDLREAALAVLP
jgi:N-acetylmuramate 1-kinase